MGALARGGDEERWSLPARAIIGRSADCAVVVRDCAVSGEHASLTWREGAWQLRDLASRNGTFVGARRLGAGERVPLSVGSTFRLADDGPVLELIDATGPGASAEGPGGTRVFAEGGVLLLPDAETAAVAVYTDEDGTWWFEQADGESRPARDGETLSVDGQSFRLALPRELPPTLFLRPDALQVHFRVSRDEEHAEMTVISGEHRHALPARSFTYMLLTLARQRLQDRETGLPTAEAGWFLLEDLASALRLESTTVGVYVHRARRQVGRIGDGVAKRIIERRKGTRQLRLGLEVAGIERG